MADAARAERARIARLPPDPRRRARRRRGSGRASARPAAELEAALAGLAEADARRAARPGEWTVAQVVDHVAQSTVRAAEELRHLLAGRRPPGPPVYEALLSGAAHRVPWPELVEGLREASAALDAVLVGAEQRPPATPPPPLSRSSSWARRTPGARRSIFAAELTWQEYALVQRLHFLDHRRRSVSSAPPWRPRLSGRRERRPGYRTTTSPAHGRVPRAEVRVDAADRRRPRCRSRPCRRGGRRTARPGFRARPRSPCG